MSARGPRPRVSFVVVPYNYGRYYVPASGPLVRRAVTTRWGLQRALPHAGEWDLLLRLAARYGIGYVAEPLYAYRMHAVNVHHRRISPVYSTSKYVLTAGKAFDSLPADASASVRRLQGAATRSALVRSVAVETAGDVASLAVRGGRGPACAPIDVQPGEGRVAIAVPPSLQTGSAGRTA